MQDRHLSGGMRVPGPYLTCVGLFGSALITSSQAFSVSLRLPPPIVPRSPGISACRVLSCGDENNARGAARLTDLGLLLLAAIITEQAIPTREGGCTSHEGRRLNWLPSQARAEPASTGDETLLTTAGSLKPFSSHQFLPHRSFGSPASNCCPGFVARCRVSRRTSGLLPSYL